MGAILLADRVRLATEVVRSADGLGEITGRTRADLIVDVVELTSERASHLVAMAEAAAVMRATATRLATGNQPRETRELMVVELSGCARTLQELLEVAT